MGRTRFLITYGTVTTVYGLGTFAAAQVFWPLAVAAPAYLIFGWMVWHRVRMCAFCDQTECPGRPMGRAPEGAEAGFHGWERPGFYFSFLAMTTAMLVVTYIYDAIFGMVATAYLAFAVWSYGTKVCPECDLPCPISPNREAAPARARVDRSRQER